MHSAILSRSHRRRTATLKRLAPAVLVALVVAGCRSGLSNAQWLWCKQHLAAVDAAAESLGLARSGESYQEPSWWQDYLTSEANATTAVISANPEFVASCDRAADAAGVGASRLSWCLADGIGATWGVSVELGHVVEVQAPAFSYQALPLDQRLDNADFVQACSAAAS
jgi:hypothetical protein